MFIGLLIVIIGVVLLLKNIGVITGDVWDYIWPIVIILIGLSMLFKPWRSKFFRWNERKSWGIEGEEDKKE